MYYAWDIDIMKQVVKRIYFLDTFEYVFWYSILYLYYLGTIKWEALYHEDKTYY